MRIALVGSISSGLRRAISEVWLHPEIVRPIEREPELNPIPRYFGYGDLFNSYNVLDYAATLLNRYQGTRGKQFHSQRSRSNRRKSK